MLRRGTDPSAALFGRAPDDLTGDPFGPAAGTSAPMGLPAALAGWAAPASYLGVDPSLVGELVRAALSSPVMATQRDGELVVGAMLASLALRGEDGALDRVLPLDAELRLLRYSVGEMAPVAVHAVSTLGDLLRSLSHCAAGVAGQTWEAVAKAGAGAPVAIASARDRELRWLQPPAPGSPGTAPWPGVSTSEPPPGASADQWKVRLAAPPPPTVGPAALRPPGADPARPGDPAERRPRGERPMPAFPEPAQGPGASTAEVVGAVTAAVGDLLASAPLELELDAVTLGQLRDTSTLERLVDAVDHLDRHLGQVDAMQRQIVALTAAVEDLGESTRSLLRHEWDSAPPQGFWLRVQKADDEVRRAVEELTAEVRTRLRPR